MKTLFRLLVRTPLRCACLFSFSALAPAGQTYLENFDTLVPEERRLEFATNGAGDSSFRIEDGRVVISATKGWETVALSRKAALLGSFLIAVDVFPLQLDYSGGYAGIFVLGTYAPDANNGLLLRVRNDAYSDNKFVLELLFENAVIGTSEPFDLSAAPGSYSAFRLMLRGELLHSEYRLTATMEPKAGVNPAALARVEFTADLPWAPGLSEQRFFGIRQNIPGDNALRMAYDNLELVY